MKLRYWYVAIIFVIAGIVSALYVRKTIICGNITKQTVYLSLINFFHSKANNAEPLAILIDDDSDYGIYTIKHICDELGIKATFAVIPSRLDIKRRDSLKRWQQNGYHIALHGFNHDDWKDWSEVDIINDITKSEHLLESMGFIRDFHFIVPPHTCNTSSIRKAIRLKGYKMVTGANISNPDTTVFQYGRLFIPNETDSIDMKRIKSLLTEAYEEKNFLILGTHSSMRKEFSEENVKAFLEMIKNIGFKFM